MVATTDPSGVLLFFIAPIFKAKIGLKRKVLKETRPRPLRSFQAS